MSEIDLKRFFLEQVKLFENFPADKVEEIVVKSRLATYEGNEAILETGDEGRFIGVMISGHAEISMTDNTGTRSVVGWPRFAAAAANPAHHALAALEQAGRIQSLVTQNVDGLHQQAGSRSVIDLHGRLDRVLCLGCGAGQGRAEFQSVLLAANPGWDRHVAAIAPDGDADLEGVDLTAFVVPACLTCGGMLKPDVVFYGESVPRARLEAALAQLRRSDALLVVGSSLMVYSGLRFARMAAEAGLAVAALNRGRTRADDLLTLKIEADCVPVLAALVDAGA